MLEDMGLSSRHADRQRLAVCHAKLDDVGAVAFRTVDHDAVLAARRSDAHLRHSFDQSSSASRFTGGASEFFFLSQSGGRRERWSEFLGFEMLTCSLSLMALGVDFGGSMS